MDTSRYKKEKRNLNIRKMEPGQVALGIYRGETTRPWEDKATGESRDLTTMVFDEVREENGRLMPDTEKGRYGLFQDAGLRTAFQNALINEGDIVEITKLDKVEIGGGRTVNQYDISVLELPGQVGGKPAQG